MGEGLIRERALGAPARTDHVSEAARAFSGKRKTNFPGH